DTAGNLYIASGYVLKVAPDGIMTPLANRTFTFTGGRGGTSCFISGDGGPARAANVCFPNRLALDQDGNLYLTDNGLVREITTDGLIRIVAGSGASNGDGVPATAVLLRAFAISLASDGSLYISESDTSGLHRSE